MIYVRDSLSYSVRPDLEDWNFESCVIEVTRLKCKQLFIWSIYRAPDSPLGCFTDILNSKMEHLPQNAETILLGILMSILLCLPGLLVTR